MKHIALTFLLIFTGQTYSQSKLPACKGDDHYKWDRCFGSEKMINQRDTYSGEYKKGIWNGHGTYSYENGEKYVGEWKDGRYHGKGTYTLKDGSKYVGEYKNDDRHGLGVVYRADGSIQAKGRWDNGILQNGSNSSAPQIAISRVAGTFRCNYYMMMDKNTGQSTKLKGEEIWTLSVNGSTGILTSPTGHNNSIKYLKSVSGPKASGEIYTSKSADLFASTQIMVDNDSTNEASIITTMLPVNNMNILMMGSCRRQG
jgi:hypothetical protein